MNQIESSQFLHFSKKINVKVWSKVLYQNGSVLE